MKKSEQTQKKETRSPSRSKAGSKRQSDPEIKKGPKKTQKIRQKSPGSPEAVTKLEEELAQSREEIESLKDRLLRTAAELDNIKKRTEKEFGQIVQSANSRLILDLLPVVDDLERSLKSSGKDEAGTFRNGIELIHQKMLQIFKKNGVEPMESVGQDFDVDKHDALLQMESDHMEPGKIIEEHEKGYFLNGQVLRHAKVIVSK